MSFNSLSFLIFLPIVLVLYRVVPRRFRWILLLVASYIFYMSWNPWLIFLIVFTTLVSYLSGLLMERCNGRSALRKTLLCITLICCLGTLFFFKYFNFIVNLVINALNLLKMDIAKFTFSLILPVGISFYTFQTLSYVIDVYRGKIRAERHLGYYALFVVYFPQLVAGPIERPENLLPQLRESRNPTTNDLMNGLRIVAVGFFKKIVVADGVAGYVNAVYNDLASANGLTVFLATLLFAIQIYCDFSGYTDIAIGAARMMGIKLMDNFNSPYMATSIRDFWRRWHISLTSWFTDYVYIPLGGSRCRLRRWALNVMIVFLLSGLWHGAALTFVAWGAIHGLYQIAGKLKNVALGKLGAKFGLPLPFPDNFIIRQLRRITTFMLVCFAWIFFRANSLPDCGLALSKLFGSWAGSSAALRAMGLAYDGAIRVIVSTVVLAFMNKIAHFNPEIPLAAGGAYVSRKVAYAYIVLAAMLAWVSLSLSGADSTFIYFQF